MALCPEEADRIYNFTCPGCRMRRVKRSARVVRFPNVQQLGRVPAVTYCKGCADAIEHDAPLPKQRGSVTVERVEERGRPDQIDRARAYLAWKGRRDEQGRGRL